MTTMQKDTPRPTSYLRRTLLGGLGIMAVGLHASMVDVGLSGDWPQWRGPNRDGQVKGAVWPGTLGADLLKQSWQAHLRPSYSGPIVTLD